MNPPRRLSSRRIVLSGALAAIVVAAMAVAVFSVSRAADYSVAGQQPPKIGSKWNPDHVHHRAGSIVGRETPELIPDDVALTMVLRLVGDLARESASPACEGFFASCATNYVDDLLA